MIRFILFINLHYTCSEVVIYLPTPLSRLGTYWPAAGSAGPNSSQLSYLSGKHTLLKRVLFPVSLFPKAACSMGSKRPIPFNTTQELLEGHPNSMSPYGGSEKPFLGTTENIQPESNCKGTVNCRGTSGFSKLVETLQDNWPIFFRNITVIKDET